MLLGIGIVMLTAGEIGSCCLYMHSPEQLYIVMSKSDEVGEGIAT